MNTLFAFSFSDWFSDSLNELTHYFNHLNETEWGIISASAVAFGFLCLKGSGLRR